MLKFGDNTPLNTGGHFRFNHPKRYKTENLNAWSYEDHPVTLLRLSITCGIWNSNHHQQLCFSLPSIKITIFVRRQSTDREKRKPTKITKWIEIHQSQRRTWPFDPVSTNREKQKPSKWIEIHQSQRRTWSFDPVELILFVFKDYRWRWLTARKTQPLVVIPHVIERRSRGAIYVNLRKLDVI